MIPTNGYRPKPEEFGCVYVVTFLNVKQQRRWKIGWTSIPMDRFSRLVQLHGEITIVFFAKGQAGWEDALHRRIKRTRYHIDGEYYIIPDPILKEVPAMLFVQHGELNGFKRGSVHEINLFMDEKTPLPRFISRLTTEKE